MDFFILTQGIIMADKQNSQVQNGVNDDITELKSLTQLRKRVISDAELVSMSQNAFRLAYGNRGVLLRNDGNDFSMLTTENGQARDGNPNTLRPLSFNLNTGRVSIRNGLDVAGGLITSNDAGISASTTGPTPLIAGQTYVSPAVTSDFTSGTVKTTMLMGSRVVAGKEDYGFVSYRDWQGEWNEIRVRKNRELEAGQYAKVNTDGWFIARGDYLTNNNKDRTTNGYRVQGIGDLFADIYHYERIGSHHFLAFHVANGGAQGWFEFRNNGDAFTNGAWHTSSDIRMKTNIQKIENPLEKLDSLHGYTYLKQGVQEAGVIAQEVEQVLPESVIQTRLRLNDGTALEDARGININGVVALLVEALREEKKSREALEVRLALLETTTASGKE
jgi:hypothetical protein